MSELSAVIAKLSGVRMAIAAAMIENIGLGKNVLKRTNFSPDLVQGYFTTASDQLEKLKLLQPTLYSDFQRIQTEPTTQMTPNAGHSAPAHFSRGQAERLIRDIDQIFEIRANSELAQPKPELSRRIFITHGISNDWRAVQSFIEKDIKLQTIELAQEPNLGRTVIEKLIDNSARCDSAVIVMTGDDLANQDEARVRENVMHEIGFFQGRYGRSQVVLLHEDGVNIPSNLSGVVYIPFPKRNIEAGLHVLQRELKAIYKM